jgi:CubicO group peptidase (beta-lactamase class C family)
LTFDGEQIQAGRERKMHGTRQSNRGRARLLHAAILALGLCVAASLEAVAEPNPWPTREWPRSSPEAQGMDSPTLARLIELRHALKSVLVVRNGYLVLEAYGPSIGPDTRQPIYSCAKSLTSALVGIALDKGYLSSTDSPMLDFFPGRTYANHDRRKRSITLENLLAMTSGVSWSETAPLDPDSSLMQMERSADWVQFYLDRPMAGSPGAPWTYDSGGAHMLSAIVQQRTGQTLAAFAQKSLFSPLGTSDVYWPADSRGISYGHRGVYMTARDMARIGYLYARAGEWNGRRIVSAQWVKDSTRRRVGAAYGQGYAWLWWVPPFGGFAANGYLGQRIFVIPEQHLVIVMTANFIGQSMMSLPESLVSRHILPAVKSVGPIPENETAQAHLADCVRKFGESR